MTLIRPAVARNAAFSSAPPANWVGTQNSASFKTGVFPSHSAEFRLKATIRPNSLSATFTLFEAQYDVITFVNSSGKVSIFVKDSDRNTIFSEYSTSAVCAVDTETTIEILVDLVAETVELWIDDSLEQDWSIADVGTGLIYLSRNWGFFARPSDSTLNQADLDYSYLLASSSLDPANSAYVLQDNYTASQVNAGDNDGTGGTLTVNGTFADA